MAPDGNTFQRRLATIRWRSRKENARNARTPGEIERGSDLDLSGSVLAPSRSWRFYQV